MQVTVARNRVEPYPIRKDLPNSNEHKIVLLLVFIVTTILFTPFVSVPLCLVLWFFMDSIVTKGKREISQIMDEEGMS